MLIKIPNADDKFVDSLKRATGCATGSKAYEKAAAEYAFQVKTIDWQEREIARLQEQIAVRDQLIRGAREAAVCLLEACGQGDLFSDSVPESSTTRRRPVPAGGELGTNFQASPQVGESMDHFLARLGRQGRGDS
ncbi:hypothetical protein ACOXVJ_27570 [Pseudomonas knackmussii]|uniref:hypothetical protein n=1 Tax=Pseudomonas knackmussii TaxID=65741 RepID=UPI003BE6FA1A